MRRARPTLAALPARDRSPSIALAALALSLRASALFAVLPLSWPRGSRELPFVEWTSPPARLGRALPRAHALALLIAALAAWFSRSMGVLVLPPEALPLATAPVLLPSDRLRPGSALLPRRADPRAGDRRSPRPRRPQPRPRRLRRLAALLPAAGPTATGSPRSTSRSVDRRGRRALGRRSCRNGPALVAARLFRRGPRVRPGRWTRGHRPSSACPSRSRTSRGRSRRCSTRDDRALGRVEARRLAGAVTLAAARARPADVAPLGRALAAARRGVHALRRAAVDERPTPGRRPDARASGRARPRPSQHDRCGRPCSVRKPLLPGPLPSSPGWVSWFPGPDASAAGAGTGAVPRESRCGSPRPRWPTGPSSCRRA